MAVSIVGFAGPAITTSLEPYAALSADVTVTGGYFLVAGGAGTNVIRARTTLTGRTYHLVAFDLYMPSATLDSGENFDLLHFSPVSGGTLGINANYSGGEMQVRLQRGGTTFATSSGTYALDAWHTFLVEMNGTTTKLYELNGSSEWAEVASGSDSAKFGGTPARVNCLLVGGGLGAGETFRVRNITINLVNDLADVQAGDPAFAAAFPVANGTFDQWGSDTNCNSGDTSGDESKVDDWETGNANDLTDFNCEFSSDSGRFTSQMTSLTVPTNFASLLVTARVSHNVAASTKTMSTKASITDGTNTIDQLLGSYTAAGNVWQRLQTAFVTAPDAGAWSQADWDVAEAGLQGIATNPANTQCTALCAELCGVGTGSFATGAAASSRRRVLHQVAG